LVPVVSTHAIVHSLSRRLSRENEYSSHYDGGEMVDRPVLIRLAVVVLLAGLVLSACGTPAVEPEAETPLKVALVLPGSIADEGYNAAAYAGLLAIEETYGAEVAFSEAVELADHDETFRGYITEGYDIIIAHGLQFGDAIEVLSPEFPDTKFIIVNGVVAGPNCASLLPQLREATYVAGHICARMSDTGSVGAIGGFAYPSIVGWLEGFRFGVEATDPDIEVTVAYIDSFTDIALGKEAALAQISAGADCVLHIADAAGIGVIQAAEEEGVLAVGFASDQNELAPNTVITSAIVDYERMIVDAVAGVLDGTFEFGIVHKPGLAAGAVVLADYHGLVPEDIAAEAEDLEQQIMSGELEVPLVTEVPE
jgi:basic membrane protein A